MTFDPFNDFATHGYLRNTAGLHDPAAVRQLEHNAFLDKLGDALAYLSGRKTITYDDVLRTHGILFGDIYPWAGQDRAHTTPDIAVTKGPVLFAHPNDARGAVAWGLQLGQDKATMRAKPGEVMGYFAYGHPFLDGNGRTIMTVHAVLAQRAGISIDWSATSKTDYLTALTRELDEPGRGHLDTYLKPFLKRSVGNKRLFAHINKTPGLDGKPQPAARDNAVLGRFSEPAVRDRYTVQQQRRKSSDPQP